MEERAKTIHYTLLHPLGHFEIPKEGAVVDLLFDLPYLIGFGYRLPTYEELNGLLECGEFDTGMGGGAEWEPFTLSIAVYTETVEAISRDPRLAQRPCPLEGVPWSQGLWRGQ